MPTGPLLFNRIQDFPVNINEIQEICEIWLDSTQASITNWVDYFMESARVRFLFTSCEVS